MVGLTKTYRKESPMKNITVLGIDLAKDVFQLHGVNEHGKKILGKKVTRSADVRCSSYCIRLRVTRCLVNFNRKG